VRIFDEPPGTFNLNTSIIAAQSGTWDSDKGMADDYIHKLGHGFGNGFWGEPMEDVFRMALSSTYKVVHSSSTALYGALDNDDMFMYTG
jgi:cobaltochelatase CobN